MKTIAVMMIIVLAYSVAFADPEIAAMDEEIQFGTQYREVIRIEASGEVIFADDMTLSEAKAIIELLIQRYMNGDICGM